MSAEVLSDDELSALKLAFDQACIELGLSVADKGRRDHLAVLLLALVDEHAGDWTAIRGHAVFQMQHPN